MAENGRPGVNTPLIDDRVLELLSSGVAAYVATRDADLAPDSTRGVGLQVHADRRTLTIYVARAILFRTLENIEDNGEIAVTFTRPSDHQSIQVKGKAIGVRESGPEDREIQERCRGGYMEQLAIVGVPRSRSRHFPYWPSVAIDIAVGSIFTQTPGPRAGARIAG